MLSEDEKQITRGNDGGMRGREPSSLAKKMKTFRTKLIKNPKDMRKKKTLIAYVVRLGAFLVNKSWNGSFMNMNFSLLALLRLDWVICMTGILKSLAIIHLGKKKLGERVQKRHFMALF